MSNLPVPTPTVSTVPTKKSPRRTFLQTCALAGTGLVLANRIAAAAEPSNPTNSTNIFDVVKTRRSVRKFKPDAVPEADITRILDAARQAPTSGNQQPWKFLVIRDRAKIDQMKEVCVQRALDYYDKRTDNITTREESEKSARNNYSNYFSAPVYIVVLTDNQSQYSDYNHWDGPLAAGYLMLAARALGYGTVFITDAIPDAVTKTVLSIPDRYTRVCITPLGVPEAWPDSPPKKKLTEIVAYETL
jgi:nitroreductase